MLHPTASFGGISLSLFALRAHSAPIPPPTSAVPSQIEAAVYEDSFRHKHLEEIRHLEADESSNSSNDTVSVATIKHDDDITPEMIPFHHRHDPAPYVYNSTTWNATEWEQYLNSTHHETPIDPERHFDPGLHFEPAIPSDPDPEDPFDPSDPSRYEEPVIHCGLYVPCGEATEEKRSIDDAIDNATQDVADAVTDDVSDDVKSAYEMAEKHELIAPVGNIDDAIDNATQDAAEGVADDVADGVKAAYEILKYHDLLKPSIAGLGPRDVDDAVEDVAENVAQDVKTAIGAFEAEHAEMKPSVGEFEKAGGLEVKRPGRGARRIDTEHGPKVVLPERGPEVGHHERGPAVPLCRVGRGYIQDCMHEKSEAWAERSHHLRH